ncbi:hypothetical protein [Aestuariispira insulae]|uniref:Uncharacterized protein n=1 Tax=Aestuariispira insulae TaxID=1461337 RepID=A0A3D9HPN0_9PROT|nr:hypothetical protein [Aestuariispira insulae]RED51419.1 hypothetical protein DFP90_103220 [Aestuariispira insulae]
MMRADLRAYAAFRMGQDQSTGQALAMNMLRKKIKMRKLKQQHRPLSAYAAYRLGQDRTRPTGNHGLFFFRRQRQSQPSLYD